MELGLDSGISKTLLDPFDLICEGSNLKIVGFLFFLDGSNDSILVSWSSCGESSSRQMLCDTRVILDSLLSEKGGSGEGFLPFPAFLPPLILLFIVLGSCVWSGISWTGFKLCNSPWNDSVSVRFGQSLCILRGRFESFRM